MKVNVVEVRKGHRPSALALAKVECIFDDAIVVIDDLRVLRSSKSGELWMGWPAYSTGSHANPSYSPVVEFINIANKLQVADAVIAAFKIWAQAQKAQSAVGQ